MINVFDYSDFRKYLADFYQAEKQRNLNFSYSYLAQKAGFKNKGFVFNIIKGAKNLSKSSIYKLSKALKHTRYEAEFFENLVSFNLAKNHDERNHYYEKMESIKNLGKSTSQAQLIRKDQYEFYSKWYHSAIRSVIDMYQFTGDYKWLANSVSPAITVKQARDSIRLLERLGLIDKHKDEAFHVTNNIITTGKEVQSVGILNFHLETMKIAGEAIKKLQRDKRNITSLTLGISGKAYNQICEETQRFQSRLLELADQDSGSDRVYQFNFHLFPLSQLPIKGNKK